MWGRRPSAGCIAMAEPKAQGARILAAYEIARGAEVVAVAVLDDGRIQLYRGPKADDLAGLKPVVAPFSVKQGQRLAEQVLFDNPQAITRSTALKELAAFVVAMLAMLQEPPKGEGDDPEQKAGP